MPSGVFKQIFLVLISLLLGVVVLDLLETQTDLVVSWCLVLIVGVSAESVTHD
jgi:hypothetical protein